MARLIGPLVLGIMALALLVVAPSMASAAVPDSPALTYGVNSGTVDAVAATGNTVYLGGTFDHVGLATGSGAALNLSDGRATTTMPAVSGSTDANPSAVYATASDGSGGFYIGGNFSHVGGIVRHGIAHILADGTVDPNFNPNAVGVVYSLATSGSTIYAGGDFTSIGGAGRSRIAGLDASTGTATSWDPEANGRVIALAVSGDGSTVYVGGFFNGTNSIGGADRNRIAAIDATTGSATNWNPDADQDVTTLAVDGSTVYAGGGFTNIGGQPRGFIAALDASSGNATGWNPNASAPVQSIAVSGSTVYAGGSFTSIGGQTRHRIAALDASTGSATSWDPNSNGPVITLAVSGDGSTVYAGGNFGAIGMQIRNFAAGLDASTGHATSWDPEPNQEVDSLAVDASRVYAGGEFSLVNLEERDNAAAIDASTGLLTSWNPSPDDFVSALAVSGSTVYVGGNFTSIGGQARNRIAAVDGTSGNATAWDPDANARVDSLAVSANGSKVYAGGQFAGTNSIGGADRNRLAALDSTTGAATSWDPNVTGAVTPQVEALALSGDGSTVYAGGLFDTVGGQARNSIAAIDASSGAPTSWNPDADGTVRALVPDGSLVYAGGDFGNIGGSARNHLAALDSTTGSATGWDPNANNIVRAIAVSGTTVYAGGDFNGTNSIGGADRNYLAALDATSGNATSWNPNANSEGEALVAAPGALYAGGGFDAIENGSGAGFAAFVEAPSNSVPPSVSGTPSAGHALTCANGTWSGGSVSFAHQWLRDNVAISGQTGTTYAVQPADTGHVIKCRVTATNLGGSTSATSAGTTILAKPHNSALPSISGTPVAGRTLSCHKGTWSGSFPQTYTYRWLRNGIAIAGATSSTYLVRAADVGRALRCGVTASNGAGSAVATSSAVVVKTPPKNTVAPKITGTPKVGRTLTCAKGTWTGSAPITYRYQWLRDGKAIAGATGASFNVRTVDRGHRLQCRVTARNVAGQATKLSAAVKPS